MPLTLKQATGHAQAMGGHDVVVHIRCDYCGAPLEPGVGGAVAWKPDPRESYLDVAYLHRECREGYAERRDADLKEMDLASFLRAVIHNLEVAG